MDTPIRIYIAAPFELQEMGRDLRDVINDTREFEVCARWLDENPENTVEHLNGEHLRIMAERDREDIRRCDGLVLINPERFKRSGTGGRHVETGMALDRDMPVFILGRRSNVYHFDPLVQCCTTDVSILRQWLGWYFGVRRQVE